MSDASMRTPTGVFHSLTGFDRDILLVLGGLEAPSGVALQRELDSYYPEGVKRSRLYRALKKLSGKGLVEVSMKDARTNAYELTELGARVVGAGWGFHEELLRGGLDD